MKLLQRFIRAMTVLAILTTLLLSGVSDAQAQQPFRAKGKEFKDVVKYIETQFGVRKTHIPMLGLANFAFKLIRPAGVKGFKLAVFEDADFSNHPGNLSFNSFMREAYRKDWQPLVRVNSKREGNVQTYIYARNAGKDVQFAIVTFEEREAVVMEVKFNPDAAARFMENPKIMGISIGNSIRGGGADIAGNNTGRVPSRRTPPDPAPRSGDIDSINVDHVSGAEPSSAPSARPSLNGTTSDERNPGLPGESKNRSALPEVNADLPGSAVATDREAIRIETRLVNLNVKAVDKAGQPLKSLRQEDFLIYEDGVRQEMTHFRPVNAPVNLILMLDLSGSTKKSRDRMVDAARKFIDALPAQDRIALVAFTRKYRTLADFTSDKALLKQSIEKIRKISGGTAFYDSMWEALDNLDQISDARKAIVVLTDGEDESLVGSEETNHSFDDLLDRASEEDVTIYPIYFSASNHYNKLGVLFGGSLGVGPDNQKRTAREQLGLLAEQTGGEVISTRQQDDLDDAYRRVASEIHTLYSLAYSPDKTKHNGVFRRISVKLNREGAIARTRKGYIDK